MEALFALPRVCVLTQGNKQQMMNVRIEGAGAEELIKVATTFFGSLNKYLLAMAKKAEMEADFLDKKTPQTEREVELDIKLTEKELELKQRQLSLLEEEMKAKELKAKADINEAQLRIKVADTRQRQLSRPMNPKFNKTSGEGKPQGKPEHKKGEELGKQGGSEALKFKPFSALVPTENPQS